MSENKDFLEKEPIGKLLLKLALPTLAAQFINMLYNIVDRIYIGHIPGIGASALTGVGVCMPLILIVSAFAALVGYGGAPRASIYMGKKEQHTAEQILGNCFALQIIVSLILTAILLKWNRGLLLAFGASENTIGYASSYMNIYAIGTIFVELTLGMNAFITAQGFAKTGMYSVLIGAVSNIILDPIMIFVLGWGAAGAATATVIGNVCTDIFFVWFLIKKSKNLSVDPRGFHISRSEIGAVFAIGIPASVTNLMQSIGIALTNRALLGFGDDKVAAMGIVMKINMIAALVLVGFAFGGQPLTGYNYGARNRTRLKATLKFAYLLEGGMALVLMAVLGFFAPQMVKIFMSDPSVVENGALMLRLQLAGMLCMGIVLISTCTFQSAGQAMGAFLLSVSRQGVVFAVVLMIALKVAGYYGVLASQAISDFLTAVLAVVLVWRWWKKVDF